AAQREATQSLHHLVIAACLFAVFLDVGDHHLLALAGMLGNPPFDVIAVAVEHAGGDGLIFFENLAGLELKAQVPVGLFFFSDENDTAGVAVEAVNDAGSIFTSGLAELGKSKLDRVNERAR